MNVKFLIYYNGECASFTLWAFSVFYANNQKFKIARFFGNFHCSGSLLIWRLSSSPIATHHRRKINYDWMDLDDFQFIPVRVHNIVKYFLIIFFRSM
jgi:hypothetical protein